jgi:hypothetical protein
MKKYIIDPALPAPGNVGPLQPAAGISTTVQAPPAQLSDQELSNNVGGVLDGTHDGVSTAYDPTARKVNITNTDKGSVAVANHEAASDPHPQYETAAEVNSKIATHSAATDPHGDRAYSDGQLSAHASASDPHTHLNASNLTSGTVPAARLSGSYNINITGSAPWGSITGKPTTISGYGITDAQPLDSNLTAVANLASNGLIARTGSGAVAARSIAVSGTGLSVSNANGVSGNPTVTSNATSANNASTIVARDASGNFSAGTITASLTGAASLNVLKAGDTMTGSLTVRGQPSHGGIRLVPGNNIGSGLIEFRSVSSDVRQGTIGYSQTDEPTDTGNIPYIAGSHTFSGQVRVANGSAAAPSLSFSSDQDTGVYRPSTDNIALGTNGTERLRIRADGSAFIGLPATAASFLCVRPVTELTGTSYHSVRGENLFPATCTVAAIGFSHVSNTVDDSFTLGDIYSFRAYQGTFGASSTVTRAVGFSVFGDYNKATTNIGFRCEMGANANNYAFYSASGVQSYLQGNLGLKTAAPTKALDINSDSFRLRTAKTPASATAAGETGEICWDANYLYICIATNTWRRIAHATW